MKRFLLLLAFVLAAFPLRAQANPTLLTGDRLAAMCGPQAQSFLQYRQQQVSADLALARQSGADAGLVAAMQFRLDDMRANGIMSEEIGLASTPGWINANVNSVEKANQLIATAQAQTNPDFKAQSPLNICAFQARLAELQGGGAGTPAPASQMAGAAPASPVAGGAGGVKGAAASKPSARAANTRQPPAIRASAGARGNGNLTQDQVVAQFRSACAGPIDHMTQVWTTVPGGTVLMDRTSTPDEVAQRVSELLRFNSGTTDIQGLQVGIKDRETYRQNNPNGSPLLNAKMNARGMAEQDVQVCAWRTRLAQLTGQSLPAAAPVGTVAGAGASCGATPQEAFANFNNSFASLASAKPNQSNAGGARDQYQYSYFLGSEGLNILAKFRTCMAPNDYQANLAALQGMRDNGKSGCEKLSTSQGSCTPTYPANWGQ